VRGVRLRWTVLCCMLVVRVHVGLGTGLSCPWMTLLCFDDFSLHLSDNEAIYTRARIYHHSSTFFPPQDLIHTMTVSDMQQRKL
jgi:hypothetical protein